MKTLALVDTLSIRVRWLLLLFLKHFGSQGLGLPDKAFDPEIFRAGSPFGGFPRTALAMQPRWRRTAADPG